MKKLIIASLMMTASVVYAHGSSYAGSKAEQTTNIVDIGYAQRVLVFESERNTATVDGQILVCRYPAEAKWQVSSCTLNGANNWQDIYTIKIPGFVLVGYEYRFVSGSRILLLYYRLK